MEFLGEILFAVLRVLAEFFVQGVLEALAELGLRLFLQPLRNWQPPPWLSAVGYAVLGAALGGLSLVVLPAHFAEPGWLRWCNLLVTPLLAGGAMSLLGAWRSRHRHYLIRLDSFTYGFLFAFALALVRFFFAR